MNNGKGLNFATALLIAQQMGDDYWVEVTIDNDTARYRMISSESYIRDDTNTSFLFDAKSINYNDESIRIVRTVSAWSDPVVMRAWQMCQEADRRAKAGEDVIVRVFFGNHGNLQYKWCPDSCDPFQRDRGGLGTGLMVKYEVQWIDLKYQDVTNKVIKRWADSQLK